MTKTVKIENVEDLVVGDKLVRVFTGSENEYSWWTNGKAYEVEENGLGKFIEADDEDTYYLSRKTMIEECFEKVLAGFSLSEVEHGGFLKCIDNNGSLSKYFTVGELYEIDEQDYAEFVIVDNDGDEWRIYDDFSEQDYTHFEYVELSPTRPEQPTETINKDVANQDWYKNQGIEPIDYMKANFTQAEFRGFLQGNVHKYMARHKAKNGLEDLKKAQVYLGWLIENWEGEK